jgi:hypothetical protein
MTLPYCIRARPLARSGSPFKMTGHTVSNLLCAQYGLLTSQLREFVGFCRPYLFHCIHTFLQSPTHLE